jgi:hypothetical protein
MNLLMVRAKLREENVAEAKAETEKVIQALEQARPAGVRYAAGVLNDGVTFIALLEMEQGQEHPLRAFPPYAELIEKLKQWYAEPPTVEHLATIGSYQLF